MASQGQALDMLVLQDCIRRLKAPGTPFDEAMDVANILMNLKRTTTMGEGQRQLLADVLRLAIERAEAAKAAGGQRPATPPPRATTPPGSPPVESPARPVAPSRSDHGATAVVWVASWNMKHLSDRSALEDGAKKDFGRLVAVLRRFDFVAIQEVTNAQKTLESLCAQLPGSWDFTVSPKFRQLNGRQCPECLAFLWRDDRIECTAGAGAGWLVTEGDTKTPACHYWHRPPFYSSFRAAGLEFVALTCHVTFSGAPKTKQREAFDRSTRREREKPRPSEPEPQPEPEPEPEPEGRSLRRRGGGGLDPLDGRRLEVENLAAASVLLREQLAARRAADQRPPALLLLADFNLDEEDAAFGALRQVGLTPLVHELGGTMVKSSHAYDNIWTSELEAQQAQVGVGKSLRSGTVDLAKVMETPAAEGDGEAAAAMSRQKSLRSQAFEHLSDHKPVWVDLCTTASGAPPDGGGGEGGAKVGPIRMSRVGGVGRTYEPGAGE